VKDNIIPTRAEAIINFRILPEETSSDVIKHIEKVVNDERLKVYPFIESITEPSPVSPTDSRGFSNIVTAIGQIFPEATFAPTMTLGGTDSKHFTLITRNIYRFIPVIFTPEDMARNHGLNERISIEDFKRGIGFYYQLIKISSN
jgi:carboxypeptidase PM20D1